MPHVLAVSNQKGGVGKTTTAINLSAALTLSLQKVLLIDLDPQGNTSSGLGFPKSNNSLGISDVLLGHQDLSNIIKKVELAPQSPLYVAPVSSFLLENLDSIEELPNKEQLLRNHISELLSRETFDYIIIDCPPSLNVLTTNAFCAASELLLPIQAEYYALEGINDLLIYLQRMKRLFNAPITLGNVLLTMVTPSTLSQEVVEQVKIFFGTDYTFSQVIPRDASLAEAPSYGRSIFQYKPYTNGAYAYTEIAVQLQERHGILKENRPSYIRAQ